LFTTIEKLITLRNLKPKKKEGFLKIISVFSFLGIMLGVAVLIIVMSVMNGFRTELTSKIIGFNSHITIKPYNYSISDDYYLKLKEKFEKSEVIKTYNGEGVIIINDSAKGVMVKGIDKSQIKKIVFFKENIIDGNFNTINENEIIIGKYLAIELGVVVGDEINIMSSSFVSTPAGSIPKQSIFKIIGVFSSGMYEFDRNISFVNLKDSLSFFEKSNDDFNVEIYLQNPMNADLIKDQIQNMDKNFYVTSWTDLNKSFFSALKVERNVMFLIITLIIIVAAFNIISGLTILIKNKTKEIGILKSLGLSNNSIVKSFFLTGFLIGFFATVTGVILGVIFSIYIEEIRQFASLIFNIQIFPEDVYFLNEMPSELSFNSIFFISIFSILITIISSLIPSLTVTKIETIKALKYE
tara:strand:- start:4872 stop:6104 length:1233 start_codon:yes stop_codon:yes gene_type:complete